MPDQIIDSLKTHAHNVHIHTYTRKCKATGRKIKWFSEKTNFPGNRKKKLGKK